MLRISFCIFIIKYKCSIFYLHAVLFPLKYTWAGLFGRSDAYILKLLNKKTNVQQNILPFKTIFLVLTEHEKKKINENTQKKSLKLPYPLPSII